MNERVWMIFSSKNRLELTKQTLPAAFEGTQMVLWLDGSTDPEARRYFEAFTHPRVQKHRVVGGPDYAILYGLTEALRFASPTHIGLLENDVELPLDWLPPLLDLFRRDSVGAASSRVYRDRVLVQADGYAVLHNAGAGHIVFTREAAELVVRHYRTGWWPDNRMVFSALSGLDIGRWGCFRNAHQHITADWHYDTVLAARGLLTLGVTPSLARMLGQDPPLADQGLELATKPVEELRDEKALLRLEDSWQLHASAASPVDIPFRNAESITYFAHQLCGLFGTEYATDAFQLEWMQGIGPFAFRAKERDAMLNLRLCGAASFLLSSNGEADRPTLLRNGTTGYHTYAPLPEKGMLFTVPMPGSDCACDYELVLPAGVAIHGVVTTRPQWFSPVPFSNLLFQLPKPFDSEA